MLLGERRQSVQHMQEMNSGVILEAESSLEGGQCGILAESERYSVLKTMCQRKENSDSGLRITTCHLALRPFFVWVNIDKHIIKASQRPLPSHLRR